MRGLVLALAVMFAAVGLVHLDVFPVDPAPSTIRPVAAPTAALAVNDRLARADVWDNAAWEGCEAPEPDGHGGVYCGVVGGDIVHVDGNTRKPRVLAHVGGRALGMDLHGDHLYVANWHAHALQRVTLATGEVETLVADVDDEGTPLAVVDDVVVAADGTVYFTDATVPRFFLRHDRDIFEARGHGRLLKWDPATSRTSTVLAGLHFANGVELAPDESFVLVCETGLGRVRRVWLHGEHAGTSDVFVDGLPGLPDNIRRDPRTGEYWLALFTLRDTAVQLVETSPPAVRKLLSLLDLGSVLVKRYALAVVLDADGTIVDSVHDVNGDAIVGKLTCAAPDTDGVWFGSLAGTRIARLSK